MADLIHKTVRMPAELVDFIETQEGNTFSEKLMNVLYEYWTGDADRQKKLQQYEVLLECKRKQLRDYSSTAMKAARVTQQLSAALRDIDTIYPTPTRQTTNCDK